MLDIGLPDSDGRDVCQALRAQGIEAPAIFLTARDNLTDRLSGFHAGGDDYLTKPFAIAELIVRIRALLRRAEPRTPGDIVRRHELVLAAWPYGATVHDNTLDAYVLRLRRKLRDLGSLQQIHTARGIGHSLR